MNLLNLLSTQKKPKGLLEYKPSYEGIIFYTNSPGQRFFRFILPDDIIGKKVEKLSAHPLFRKSLD